MGNGLGTVTDAYQRAQEARGAAIEGHLPDLKKLHANGVSMNSHDKVRRMCSCACVLRVLMAGCGVCASAVCRCQSLAVWHCRG